MIDPVVHLICQTIDEKKGEDILVVDLQNVSVISDYFIICTGRNARHIHFIEETVWEKLVESKKRPAHTEGDSLGGWVLLDLGDIVVHIMSPEKRAYYELERLWSHGTLIPFRTVERKVGSITPPTRGGACKENYMP